MSAALRRHCQETGTNLGQPATCIMLLAQKLKVRNKKEKAGVGGGGNLTDYTKKKKKSYQSKMKVN